VLLVLTTGISSREVWACAGCSSDSASSKRSRPGLVFLQQQRGIQRELHGSATGFALFWEAIQALPHPRPGL
jgi:hypothetical protein